MKNLISILLLCCFSIIGISCREKNNNIHAQENLHEIENSNNNIEKIKLDEIGFFPKDIDTCFEIYSIGKTKVSKRNFHLIKDNQIFAYLRINGVLKKFILNEIDYLDKNTTYYNYNNNGDYQLVLTTYEEKNKISCIISLNFKNKLKYIKEIQGKKTCQ